MNLFTLAVNGARLRVHGCVDAGSYPMASHPQRCHSAGDVCWCRARARALGCGHVLH